MLSFRYHIPSTRDIPVRSHVPFKGQFAFPRIMLSQSDARRSISLAHGLKMDAISHKRALSAMADDDKIDANLPREVADFFGPTSLGGTF